MAEFLARTPRFSVNIQDSYDVLQETGQKIEFSETRTITVSRPNQLRVEVVPSDGDKQLVLYDGKDITSFSPSQNLYAQASKPGGIDEVVRYFLQDLHHAAAARGALAQPVSGGDPTPDPVARLCGEDRNWGGQSITWRDAPTRWIIRSGSPRALSLCCAEWY